MGLLEDLERRISEAAAARSDVPVNELLVPLNGDDKAETFDEVNAAGRMMTFLCARVESQLADVVPGSVKKHCNRCGKQVWMSPATRESMSKLHRTLIICLDCAERALGLRLTS